MQRKSILVVEDEYFLADDCVSLIKEAGLDVVGPLASLKDALELVDGGGTFDAALLDVNLQGHTVFPLLDIVLEKRLPVAIYTGYPTLPKQYAAVATFLKPNQSDLAIQYLSKRV